MPEPSGVTPKAENIGDFSRFDVGSTPRWQSLAASEAGTIQLPVKRKDGMGFELAIEPGDETPRQLTGLSCFCEPVLLCGTLPHDESCCP